MLGEPASSGGAHEMKFEAPGHLYVVPEEELERHGWSWVPSVKDAPEVYGRFGSVYVSVRELGNVDYPTHLRQCLLFGCELYVAHQMPVVPGVQERPWHFDRLFVPSTWRGFHGVSEGLGGKKDVLCAFRYRASDGEHPRIPLLTREHRGRLS